MPVLQAHRHHIIVKKIHGMLLARLSGLVSGQASGPAACSALMKVSRSFAAAPQEETDTNDETFTVKVHDFKV